MINSKLKWHNVIWQLIHLGLGGILMIVLWVILGRHWSVELFGYFNYFFAYIAIVGIFFDFGLDILLVRLLAKQKLAKQEPQTIPANCLKLKKIVFLMVLISSVFLGYALAFPPCSLVFFILGVCLLSLTSYFNAVFRARDRLHIEAKIGLLQKLLFILPSVVAVSYFQQGIFFLALAYFGSHLLALLITIAILYKKDWLKVSENTLTTSAYWHQSWPLFMTALLAVLAMRLDVFLLQWISSPAELGHYTAIMRLFEGLSIISSAFIAVVFPKFVEKTKDRLDLSQFYSDTQKLLATIGFVVVIPGIFLIPIIIMTLYGDKFIPGIILLQLLLPSLLLVFMTTLAGNLLMAVGHQHQYMKILAIILIFQLVVNLLTINLWGAMGAVIGYWLRELLLFIILLFYTHRVIFKASIKV